MHLNPRHTVRRILEEHFVIHGRGDAPFRRTWVVQLLERVGLPPSAADRYPHAFSCGQRQRIGLARARDETEARHRRRARERARRLRAGAGHQSDTGSASAGSEMVRIAQAPQLIVMLNPDLTYRQIWLGDRGFEPPGPHRRGCA
jgi:hypothetical protein